MHEGTERGRLSRPLDVTSAAPRESGGMGILYRHTPTRRSFLGVVATLALGSWPSFGCSAPRTPGRRIRLETQVAAAPDTFVNDFGWKVELSSAMVAFSHLYYVTGEPVGASSWFSRVFIPSAHAHPGHYNAGDILGEMPDTARIDLLARTTHLGSNEGVTGEARSAVVAFGTLEGSSTDTDLDGGTAQPVLFVEGRATMDEQRLRFRASADVADLLNPESDLPEIAGCPFAGALDGDGTVVCRVEPAVWLDQVDFSTLDAPPDAASRDEPASAQVVNLARGTQAHNAFTRGAKKAMAYSFEFEKEVSTG